MLGVEMEQVEAENVKTNLALLQEDNYRLRLVPNTMGDFYPNLDLDSNFNEKDGVSNFLLVCVNADFMRVEDGDAND